MVPLLKKLVTCFSIVILSSVEVFSQWIQQPFPNSEYLWKVRFVDAATGWILGDRFVYKTTDRGASWNPQDSSKGPGLALCTLNANVVFYATYTGVPPYSRGIRRTTNGGATWESADTAAIYYTHIGFIDSQTGFAVGGRWTNASDVNPVILRTSDGGSTWATVWAGTGLHPFTGISFPNPINGWAVTYDAYLYHSSDSGLTWTLQDSVGRGYPGSYLPVRDYEFVTSDSGWAVGGISGEVLIASTSNGGVTWFGTGRPGPSATEVEFLNSREGWMVGEFDSPWHTTNGGASWQQQTCTPQFSMFESISMVNASLGWAVGANGKVYGTLGPNSVSYGRSGSPIEFGLEQNYPNPFNPTTVVSYEIAGVRDQGLGISGQLPAPNEVEGSVVSLNVFDLLGREVAVLVNERKGPGSYSVQFNAGGLASGVYFYRMQTGSFVETKKLMLIR